MEIVTINRNVRLHTMRPEFGFRLVQIGHKSEK